MAASASKDLPWLARENLSMFPFPKLRERTIEILCVGYDRRHCDHLLPSEIHNIILRFTICELKEGDPIAIQSSSRGVRLHSGLIRYIGFNTNFDDEIVGLELDRCLCNGGNGTINGQQLFITRPGKAFFIPHRDIIRLNRNCGIMDGAFARLQDLHQMSSFNGTIVRIVSFFAPRQRWKVRPFVVNIKTKYLGAPESKLCPLPYWEANLQSPPVSSTKSLTVMPSINDRVRTRRGLIGRVSYVPSVSVGYIGLTLVEWNLNGNDGTFDGTRFLAVENGYGYFVLLKNLVENMTPKCDGVERHVVINRPRTDSVTAIDGLLDNFDL